MKGGGLLGILWVALSFSSGVYAATTGLDELRMAKRFGIGVEAGGALAVMGISVDVNITENFSVGGGLGIRRPPHVAPALFDFVQALALHVQLALLILITA